MEYYLQRLYGESVLSALEHKEEQEDLRMWMDIRISDDTLRAFFSTSEARNLAELVKHQDLLDSKTVLSYKYREKTYRATLYNYYQGLSVRRRQLTVKLSHDGFVYHPRAFLVGNRYTHGRDRYFVLDPASYEVEMPFLVSLSKEARDVRENPVQITFYYSIAHKRMDIQFHDEGDSFDTLPFMLITFEHGPPLKNDAKYRRTLGQTVRG
ncbi:MAG: hypothetical protein BJ554DRAFT_4186 [Olpidium bornovanus]|uniref:Uncharacterized protein n=1 Tax=Olpidium bornovanus TaxID=278681 RepID=A0A8H7ZND4_9FUNG|nr:MAG: hypothetical protein BJ554DRAFT_4186 [Olpidium bornovanus]